MKKTDLPGKNKNVPSATDTPDNHTPGMPRTGTEYLEFLTLTLAGLALAFSAFDSGMTRWSVFPIFSRALGILAGAFWLFHCISQGKMTIRHGWLWLPLLIFWGSMIPQFLTAKDISLAFDGFSNWTSALLLFTVLANFPRDGAARRLLLFAFLASGFIIAIFGLNTYASSKVILKQVAQNEKIMYGTFGEDGMVENARQRIESADARGPFPIANSLAGYLGLIIPIQLVVTLRALREKRPPAIAVNLLVMSVEILCFALTFSRGGYVALGFGFLLMLVFAVPPRIFPSLLKFGAVLLAAAVLAGLLAAFMTSDNLRIKAGHSMDVRGGYWDGALNIFKNENPVTGIGLGNFVHCYYTYRTLAGSEVLMAHNHYLQLLCDAGIIGLAGFLFFWLMFFRKSSKLAVPAGALSGNMESSNRFLLWFPIGAMGFAVAYFPFGGMNGWEEWTSLLVNGGPVLLRVLLYLGAPVALGIIWAFYYKINRNLWADESGEQNHRLLFAAFIGGIGAVLVHSLVDFDLELPSLVMTLAGAAGLALNFSSDASSGEKTKDLSASQGLWTTGTVLATCLAFFFMVIQPGITAFLMKKAADNSWDVKQKLQSGKQAHEISGMFGDWFDTLDKAAQYSGGNPFVLKESADAKLYFLNNLSDEGIKQLDNNRIYGVLMSALKDADRAAELAPYDPLVRDTCALANDTAAQGKEQTLLNKARENYEACIRLDPQNPIRLYGLWCFHVKHQNYKEAESVRQQALALNDRVVKMREAKAIPLGMSGHGMIAGSPLPKKIQRELRDWTPPAPPATLPPVPSENGGQK